MPAEAPTAFSLKDGGAKKKKKKSRCAVGVPCQRKRLLTKARPEPDFRYFSKARA